MNNHKMFAYITILQIAPTLKNKNMDILNWGTGCQILEKNNVFLLKNQL